MHLLSLDVDGTLVPGGSDQPINGSVSTVLEEASGQGIILMVTSGRPLHRILPLFTGSLVRHFGTSYGAATYIESSGAYRLYHPCVLSLQAQAWVSSGRWPLAIETSTGYAHTSKFPADLLTGEVTLLQDQDVDALVHSAYHVHGWGWIDDRDELPLMPDKLFRHRGHWEIFGDGSRKVLAVDRVRRELGLPWSRIGAIGDGDDDAELLVRAGMGLAVLGSDASNVAPWLPALSLLDHPNDLLEHIRVWIANG